MKRTMKKMLSFGLVAAMSLTMLAGCGNSKETATIQPATTQQMIQMFQMDKEEKKPTGECQDWCSGSGCQW